MPTSYYFMTVLIIVFGIALAVTASMDRRRVRQVHHFLRDRVARARRWR